MRRLRHDEKNQAIPDRSANKEPEQWVTGDEPMTGAQDSYVHSLAREAGEEVSHQMTKAQASEKIEQLQEKTGRGTATRKARPRKKSVGRAKSNS